MDGEGYVLPSRKIKENVRLLGPAGHSGAERNIQNEVQERVKVGNRQNGVTLNGRLKLLTL